MSSTANKVKEFNHQPLEYIYSRRFNEQEEFVRAATWEVLCERFLQRFIPEQSVVLDLAAGEGHFIKNIQAQEKIAVDLNPNVVRLNQYGITAIQCSALDIASVLPKKVDIIFISNFLEHLSSKHTVLEVLEQCSKCLNDQGQVIILQPDIKAVGLAYWDYIDHHIAITYQNICEALGAVGYTVTYSLKRFLPYTAKSRLGHFVGRKFTKFFVNLYLSMPFIWRVLGGQCFIVARKSNSIPLKGVGVLCKKY